MGYLENNLLYVMYLMTTSILLTLYLFYHVEILSLCCYSFGFLGFIA